MKPHVFSETMYALRLRNTERRTEDFHEIMYRLSGSIFFPNLLTAFSNLHRQVYFLSYSESSTVRLTLQNKKSLCSIYFYNTVVLLHLCMTGIREKWTVTGHHVRHLFVHGACKSFAVLAPHFWFRKL